jgi:hypothetical protein
MELDFIFREIFPGCLFTIDIHEAISARCIVYMEHDVDVNIAKYIIANGKKLVIYHLGDERGDKTTDAYQFAQAILRNYYHKQIFEREDYQSKTFWMPNGYRNGIGRGPHSAVKPASQRKQLARFIGWLDNSESINGERLAFKHVAANIQSLLDCVSMPGFGGTLSPYLYGALMEQCIFAPCPAGNAAETIRIFDALESGCIPITCHHEFLRESRAMGSPPFLFLRTWNELSSELNKASTQEFRSESLYWQRRCTNYWKHTKASAHAISMRALV